VTAADIISSSLSPGIDQSLALMSRPAPPARIEVPTGIGVYPEEIVLLPRKVCERAAPIVHWSVLPEGGHFAPAEVPETYVRELRTFFISLR
jgi:pimeloyl-ACP methyl ester carboxylesterase